MVQVEPMQTKSRRINEMANVKNKPCAECVLALLVLCNLLVCFTRANEQYEIPQPKFKLLKPKGFQVSIPDEDGIQLFAFHGNLNKKMEKMGNGDFSMDIIDKSHGKWIYQNQKLKVRAGDTIYFWVFVIKNGVGYTHEDGVYEITDRDFNRVSKKVHKLRKRYAHQSFSNIHSFSPEYKPYGYERSAVVPRSPSEFSDSTPLGYGYGHGLPHHHQRGYHNHGSEDFQHSSEYHDSYGLNRPRGPHENYGHGRFHNHHPHAYHGHGHQGFIDHPHHKWGHKHNHDCDWSDSNESDSSEEIATEQSSTEDTSTEMATTTVVITKTPEPDAVIMSTTTVEPQIDIRFGANNK